MKNKPANTIVSFYILIFSSVLALGTWNPFIPYSDTANAESGIGFAQITTALFIVYLFVRKKVNDTLVKRWSNILYTFFAIYFIITFFYSLNNLSLSTIIVFFKLLLVIFMCLLLPKLFLENKSYVYISIYTFSIVSSIIALLFWIGALEPYVSVSQGRFTLFGENPNSTSARFALAFILLLHVILRNPFSWSKIRYIQLILLLPLINIVMASGSRGSFLILAISIFLYLVSYPYKKVSERIWYLSSFTAILITGSVYILSNNTDYVIIDRLVDSYITGNDAGRDRLNEYAINIWLDSPITGEGIVGFVNEMKNRYGETRTVHNLYFYILSTSGVVGLLCFLIFIYKLLLDSLAVRKHEPISFVILIFMLLMAYKTGGILTYILMWYIFSIVITFKLMKEHEK